METKKIKNNRYIMTWMMVLMYGPLAFAVFLNDMHYKLFWLGCSIFILTFVNSLKVSIKQEKILEEIRRDKNV